jgi:hypothetical protein
MEAVTEVPNMSDVRAAYAAIGAAVDKDSRRSRADPEEHSLRGQLAAAYHRKVRDHDRIAELRRELTEIQLAGHIRRFLAKEPALTVEQRQRLADLLAPPAGQRGPEHD